MVVRWFHFCVILCVCSVPARILKARPCVLEPSDDVEHSRIRVRCTPALRPRLSNDTGDTSVEPLDELVHAKAEDARGARSAAAAQPATARFSQASAV